MFGGLYAGALGTLATLIPSAPGHFGTFDFFAAKGFEVSGLDPRECFGGGSCFSHRHPRAGYPPR